jgi:hypothetical protein
MNKIYQVFITDKYGNIERYYQEADTNKVEAFIEGFQSCTSYITPSQEFQYHRMCKDTTPMNEEQ